MNFSPGTNTPLVSVIIPCYNQGSFLSDAIRSVMSQDYPYKEIIVIDDGSSDNTCQVVEQFEGVIYLHQENQGLAAARNTGVVQSKGEYFIFLDADDLLAGNAIAYQVELIKKMPGVAFISGGHFKSDADLKTLKEETVEIKKDHYLHLLRGNYIGMHAAVIYNRKVFDEYKFDIALKAVEDYDLYLKIAAKYPVAHHTTPVAIYRKHNRNMSADTPMMLAKVLHVLQKHRQQLKSVEEKKAFRQGISIWIDYYCREMYDKLREDYPAIAPDRKHMLAALWKYRPALYIQYKLFK